MDTDTNPLDVPELLDHALRFLDARADLHACALVNRSWVYPAQSRIFSEIEFLPDDPLELRIPDTDTQLSRLLAILKESPHLPGFISTLTIQIANVKPYLERLCDLQYELLSTLNIASSSNTKLLDFQASHALRRLLSTPTLSSVSIDASFEERRDFLRIWEKCSKNIKHLSFWGNFLDRPTEGFSGQAFARIKLESLADLNFAEATRRWTNNPQCPFDVSSLRAFKIPSFMDDSELHGELLSAACETIEVLATPVRLSLLSIVDC